MALLSDNAEAAGLDLAFASALVSFAWAGGQVVGGSAVTGFAEATTDATAYARDRRRVRGHPGGGPRPAAARAGAGAARLSTGWPAACG